MLTIGVTGHRFLAELPRVSVGIDAAFQQIQQRFPQQPLTLLSSLAEGADCLAAQRGLVAPGDLNLTALIAPLPLPLEDYLNDFSTPQARQICLELVGCAQEVFVVPQDARFPSGSRSAAYARAGYYILEHCQVLLAVWDGKDAQGGGGTGEIARMAQQNHLPIAWVHAGNRLPGTQQPTSLGVEQGRVTWIE